MLLMSWSTTVGASMAYQIFTFKRTYS
jgi:hypothetical protein